MKTPLPALAPVAIMLDDIDVTGPISFAGIDLDSGARVRVSIEQLDGDAAVSPANPPSDVTLVLTLSVQSFASSRG